VNVARVEYVIRTVAHTLTASFDIPRPRIAVCGLNPHAGEGGYLGREDLEIIVPAIQSVRADGLDVTGPAAADTIFAPEIRARFDAVISMYHDQGLPALKALGFGHAVNVTLGLPFIRTSVDHGTALALAGTGQADSGSMRSAIDLAISLSAHRAAI
ncbi:MAG: PdxA family dehydrogenase, partial [Gammaproteobacteria bacterium]